VETTGQVAPLILEDELQNPYESPAELPQGMTNELSKSYENKALEPMKEHKREQDARIKERLDTVYSGVRDLTNYEPDLSTEQKQRKLINGLMEVKLGRIPKDVNEYQQARFEFANKYYKGKGGESDEALFAQIKTDTDKRAANVDLHKSLQDVALVGSLDGKGFTNWLKTQEDTGMSPERKQSMLHSYNEYKQNIADQYGDSHKYAKKTFEKLMGGDIDKAMEYVNQIKGTMTDEEHENYLGLLREVVLANPEPKVEEMLTLIGLNSAPLRTLARSYRNTGKVVDSIGDLVKQAPSGIAHAVREGGTYGFAKLFGSEEAAGREKENAARDKILAETLRKNSDFVADVKRIFRDDYDPIEPHFDGGVMGAIESGVYAAPAALTTTAMLFIPYAGLPLVGSTMFGASREKFRQRILDNGGTREEAANNADALAMITTVPNMLLERLQALAFVGKAPMFNGAMQKVNRLFNNKLARGVGRFTIANIGETNVEMGQEYLEELVQMMGSSFSEVIPDVQWMGEGGVFDGFAYQYLSTAVAVAPLGVTASIGGVRSEDRAMAYKDFPREIRAMNGVSAVDNDRIDNAETIAETVEAVQIANANADPNSDEARDAVEAQMLREEQELTSVENLKRAGLFPMIVADKQKDGVVDIVDPQTGEVLDRIDNNPVAAAQAVFSYMELQDQATQEQLDEMSTMIEAAMLDVKETGDKGAKVELDLGNKMDVRGLLEAFPEFKGRLENQVGRLEQLESKEILNGGDGGMSRAVFGLNQAVHGEDVKSYTNRAYAGTSAMTLVHERGHVSWKRALESGATTLTKTYDFFKELDKNLVGKKDRNGKELRFMPEGTTADNFTALDEAVAEFSEVMLLRTRNGEKTAMRDVVGRQMSAMAKARKANAGSFKGFYQAMQDFFGKVFARNLAFKQAVKSGQINEGQLNEFYDILVKANAQEQFEKDVDAETQAIIEGESMSIGSGETTQVGRATITPNEDTKVLRGTNATLIANASFSIGAWHGTPHKVDKFSTEKIGTGEGAQAYGYGLYFAEDKGVAEGYRINLAYDPDKQRINGRQINDEYNRYTRANATQIDYQIAEGLERLMMHDSPAEVIEMFKEQEYSDEAIKYFEESDYETFGGLYQVELNVEQDELLDWDKPLSEQSERVRDAVEKMLSQTTGVPFSKRNILRSLKGDLSSHDGGSFYNTFADNIGNNIQQASKDLASVGIKGIKYLDGTSRKAGEGTYNYVIFDGKDITIKEENGNAVSMSDLESVSMSIGEVPAEIANSTEPLVEQIYLKETAKFKEGVESGRIKTEADIRDFIGKHMVMHQPDTAMAGEVKVDGESFVKGKGGVYYPVLFSDEGYFWASTAAKADEMAGALNEISERNGGKIFMALTSADVDKLFSSTTMSVGTMNFFKQLTKNPRKYGITENQFNKILVQASQTKITSKLLVKAGGVNVLDKNGNKTYKTKVQEFGYKLTKGNTLEQNVAEMEGWLQPFSSDKSSGSSFDVRKAFVFDMMRHVSTHLKARPEQSKAVSELLTHESNAFAKGAVLKGKLSMAAFQQGLGDMLSEPLTKTFQKFGKDGKGYVYAIIEIDGKVKAIDTKGHESYPKAIVSVDGNLPTVHIMKRGYHWTDIAQEKDSGARVPRTNAEMNKVMPTGGFSAYKGRPLQFGDVQEGAEGVDLAFSIGDARMNDTIITNAAMRMRDPEGVATVMKGIIRRIEALRRDVPRIISAFGKDVTQEAIVDAKLIGDLRSEAKQMRRDGIEAAENAVYDRYGDVLSNEDLVKLKSQPVTELVMAEGGMESISSAKRRKGDDDLTAGEYEEAAGLPPMYYGGSQSPDQMATQLFNEGFISDDSVSAMMEALEAEIMSVSNRKADLKEAKALMGKGRKAARTKAQEWLDERIAEQKRDYSPTVRARRALVKLSAIRRSMPMELRGKIEGDAKLLTMGDEARLKYLEETLAKVDKVVDEWIRKETRKSIKEAYKVLGKKTLTADTETELTIIKKFGDMTALQKNEKLTELYDLLDAQPTPAESLVLNEQVALLETYGNQKDMTSLQLVSLLETLGTVIKRGRTIRSMLAQERKANDSANKSMTVDVLSGGKGQMSEAESDENDERVRKDKQSVIKELKHKPKHFHAQNLSFEGLLNMLSRKDKGSETYKSEISKKWGVLVHRATRTNKVANQHLQENYDAKMKQIFNKKGIRLSSHISKEMMDRQDTGFKKVDFGKTGSTTNKSIEVIVARRIINGEVDPAGLGLNERDVELITAAYEAKMSSKRTKKGDMDQVKWKHENTGKAEPLKRSQSQVMALVMMFRQDGIKQSMIREGYSEELMANLEKSFLTKESKEVLEWMSEQYDRNYDVVNAVYRKQHGVDLPKIEFYAPVRRVVDKDTDDIDITGSGTAFGTTPSQLLNRAKNFNKVDPNANAMDMFMEHMLQSNHYVSWADPIRELRATFHNKDVRRAIKDYAGGELLGVIDERIAWLADGGNRQSKKIKWLDNMRMAHTFGSLAYDLGITIKQFTSLPAYAFDMGVRNWVKYEAEFMKNPIKNAKEMIATEYVQTRFKDGYTRDVAEGLKLEAGNNIQNYILKGFQAGMMFGKVGDIVPVIVGGWAAKKHAYNEAIKAGMTPKQAESQSILAFEMATDRSQQAVDMKDLSSFSGGNSAMKLFTMYKTSPRQYYAVAYEALFDAFAGRKNGWHNAARKMAISHAVLPLMFQFVSDMWRMVGDEDKELEGSDYLRAMLLGPLNGLYIAGEVAAPLASMATGARVYDAQIPAFSAINSTVRGVAKINRGDFWEGTNEIAKQAGKWSPIKLLNFTTYWSIITKQDKLLDRFND